MISPASMRYNICQHILRLVGEGSMFTETYEYIKPALQTTYSVIIIMKEKFQDREEH